MLLTLANTSYEFRQAWPCDVIFLIVFLTLWAMAKPEIDGLGLLAFCLVGLDAFLMFQWPIGPMGILLIPLALIWFSEMLGGMRGMIGNCVVTTETPSWMVAGFGWLALLIMSGFIIRDCSTRKPDTAASSVTSVSPSTSIAPSPANRVTPTPATTKPLPLDITLITPIQMPMAVRGRRSGTVTLPRGTRVQLVSVGRDSIVIRYIDSAATVPTTATDLHLTSQ